MRLSDRIIEGSFFMRHKVGGMSGDERFGCVLQIAAGQLSYRKVLDDYPWLQSLKVQCPCCGTVRDAEGVVSIHLNDRHRWPLAKIADWVRSIEPPEPDVPETQERGCETSPELTAPREALR